MAHYIAYYRVSTQRQGQSGLGLDAQRSAVAAHIGSGTLLAEYTEIESGKRHSNRPQLQAALAECRKRKATLVIAKLDRLSRNVAFIATLMDSGAEIVCCDMPQANRLTLHILAAVAENEREMISARTKAALTAAKARGTQLGNPRWQESIERARVAKDPLPVSPQLVEMVAQYRAAGETLRVIAARLNSLGLKTPKGNQWYASTVRTLVNECQCVEQVAA
jgi:DNA invertase Pin-like site-specific DNA recombinase